MASNRDPFDSGEDLDWHGAKSKRKRDDSERRAAFLPFVVGFLLALVLGVCGFGAYLSIKGLQQVSGDAVPTAVVTHELNWAPEGFATYTPGPTLLPIPTRTPTISSTQVRVVAPSDHIFEYDPATMTVRTLAAASKPGYIFRGLRFGPDSINLYTDLYVAHTRGTPQCGDDEGYWEFSSNDKPNKPIIQITYPSMTSPKRITFDSKGNRYILAYDCKKLTEAVFKFDGSDQLIDTFTLAARGDDLRNIGNNHILVSISGFAGGDAQFHLIELRADPDTGKLVQVGQYGKDDYDVSYVSMALYREPSHTQDTLIVSRAKPGYLCILQSASLDNLDNFQQLTSIQADRLRNNENITDLTRVNETVFGLDAGANSVLQFDSILAKAVERTRVTVVSPHAFAVDPHTALWYIAGSSDPATK